MDDALLDAIREGGVVIKGGDDDEAVLCTHDVTYAVKRVDSTNTMWLLRPGEREALVGGREDSVARVAAVANSHLELVEVAPRLERLRAMLLRHPYAGPDEAPDAAGLVGHAAVCASVQASDTQLSRALRQLGAFELDGALRVASSAYQHDVLNRLVWTAFSEGYELSAVPEVGVCEAMNKDEAVRSEMVRHVLLEFSEPDSDVLGGTWSLDLGKVATAYAAELVAEKPRWALDQLLAEWKERMPEGMPVSAELLRGLALLEPRKEAPDVMEAKAFCEAALPRAPAQRFAALFAERARWAWEDLGPYVEPLDVGTPDTKTDVLLMRYTRKIQPDADKPPLYGKR